jgi:hypothetical protein
MPRQALYEPFSVIIFYCSSRLINIIKNFLKYVENIEKVIEANILTAQIEIIGKNYGFMKNKLNLFKLNINQYIIRNILFKYFLFSRIKLKN